MPDYIITFMDGDDVPVYTCVATVESLAQATAEGNRLLPAVKDYLANNGEYRPDDVYAWAESLDAWTAERRERHAVLDTWRITNEENEGDDEDGP